VTHTDSREAHRTLPWTLFGIYVGGVAVVPSYAPFRLSLSPTLLLGLWTATTVVGAAVATAGRRRLAAVVDRLASPDESGWDLLVVFLVGYLPATVATGAVVSFAGVVGPAVATAVTALLATGLAVAGVVARARGRIDFPSWAEPGDGAWNGIVLFGSVFLYTYLQVGALLGAASGIVAMPLGLVCGVGAVGLRRLNSGPSTDGS
jgi:hypothetical protein